MIVAAPPIDRVDAVLAIEPILLRPAAAAVALGISARTLRRLSAAGAVPMPVRLGARLLWSADELRAWAAAGCPARDRWAALRGDPP